MSPFLHQLTMQASLFEPGRPVIFTCSTGERMDATMKGPSEKGDQFAVLEYMKGGQMVTHSCAPLQRIEFFIRSLSPSPEASSSGKHVQLFRMLYDRKKPSLFVTTWVRT